MFKIYQIHEMSGEYEDYRDTIIGSYLRKEKAEEVIKTLQDEEEERRARALKCQNCPVHDYDCNNYLVISEYCKDFDDVYERGDDEEERLFCKNEYCSYPAYDNMYYEMQEVEVEE